MVDILIWAGVGIAALYFLICLLIFLKFGRVWMQAFMAGLNVPLVEIIALSFRKVDMSRVVRMMIVAKESGVSLSHRELARAYLLGVDLERVTLAYVQLKQKDPDATFDQVLDAERAGRLKDLLK